MKNCISVPQISKLIKMRKTNCVFSNGEQCSSPGKARMFHTDSKGRQILPHLEHSRNSVFIFYSCPAVLIIISNCLQYIE